jgi:alpha-amylase/alpha-mannosidase (GH57 family)
MHQPYYRDILTGEVTLPWVRLHGIKDYLDMVKLLEDFPNIHQTFNLTCCLIDQLEGYTSNGAGTSPAATSVAAPLVGASGSSDKFLELSKKKAQDLSDEEKDFILFNFFTANVENMFKPHPRYYDLLLKRGTRVTPDQIFRARRRFKTRDFLDLQVWFNLAWFDPFFRENIPELKELIKKGKNFTEEEKDIILDKQLSILKDIIPTYKKFQESGQIEVTTSPYYHPILPLIYNMAKALESMPQAKLPKMKINFPEDVKWQIDKAVEKYKNCFSIPPRGMWPPEGAVSEDILPLIMEAGINWIATDEGILLKSIEKLRSPELVYKPYLLEREGKRLNILFRDHTLSDLIGFVYYRMPTNEAIDDFLKRLYDIQDELGKKGTFLVTVALDGENAWEHYPNDGRDFLIGLYERLSQDKNLKMVTVSEFLKENPPKDKIKKLFPGSWINTDFSMWVGNEEKNLAWEYLTKVRNKLSNAPTRGAATDDVAAGLVPVPNSKIDDAWHSLYIAEGSDWFWWYGGSRTSIFDEEFDRLYRRHLSNIYSLIGEEPPDYLKLPIKIKPTGSEPTSLIRPTIDGKISNYYEWLGAGLFDASRFKDTMRQAQTIIRRIFYGFDLHNLYLRLDLNLKTYEELCKPEDIRTVLLILPVEMRLEILTSFINRKLDASVLKRDREGNWIKVKSIERIALDQILELAIGFEDLGVKEDDELRLSLFLEKRGVILEYYPRFGPMLVKVPSKDYESHMWSA